MKITPPKIIKAVLNRKSTNITNGNNLTISYKLEKERINMHLNYNDTNSVQHHTINCKEKNSSK